MLPFLPASSRPLTNRRFRESLNWKANDLDYGLDINAADHWIEAGWNVGVW
jgi:ribose 1,5-bisphosphokinase PhnN